MPGNIVKPSGCQTGESSLLGTGNPQRTTEWEKEPSTLRLPSLLPARAKLGRGLEAALQERPRQSLGAAVLPAPTLALGGWCGRMAGWGHMAASGQGAKKTQS